MKIAKNSSLKGKNCKEFTFKGKKYKKLTLQGWKTQRILPKRIQISKKSHWKGEKCKEITLKKWKMRKIHPKENELRLTPKSVGMMQKTLENKLFGSSPCPAALVYSVLASWAGQKSGKFSLNRLARCVGHVFLHWTERDWAPYCDVEWRISRGKVQEYGGIAGL